MTSKVARVKLDEVALMNPPLSAKLAAETPVTFVPMAAASAKTASVDTSRIVSFGEVRKGYTPFNANDLLIAKITPSFENGKIVQARITTDVGFGSTEFHVIRPFPEVLDARFLLHFLRQDWIRHDGMRKMTGTAGQRRLSESFFRRLEILLLPMDEQQRVSNVLDRAEILRAKRRTAARHLETLRQSIFLDMFGDPVRNRRGLPVRRLIELIDENRPITYGILKPGPHVEGGVPYVRVLDMQEGGIQTQNLRRTSERISAAYARSLLRPEDLLLSIRGHVGRLAVVPGELDGANITQDTARLAVKGVSPTFLLECLRSSAYQQWMARHTKGMAVRGINLGDLKKMPIPVPPSKDQEEFAQRIEATGRLVSQYRASDGQMESAFLSIQQLAFRGLL